MTRLQKKTSQATTSGTSRFGPICKLAVALGFAFLAAFQAAHAREFTFDIEPQPTGDALLRLAEIAEVQILFSPHATQKTQFSRLRGTYSVHNALKTALTGTGLAYEFKSEDFVVVKADSDGAVEAVRRKASALAVERERVDAVRLARLQQSAQDAAQPEHNAASSEAQQPLDLGPQVVTGSRIAREPGEVAAQLIVFTAEDLRNTGAATLEHALRQLPQNFNGTTEFGGARMYNSSGDMSGRLLGTANINGSSTINLRGIEERGTLVLIDGKRAGDSGLLGGFTDISEFPISMIERVEVQLDGSSSIYGSDAIGGVVNVILKKAWEGARLTLRRTERTGGGLTEDSVAIFAGTSWSSGTAMLGLDSYKASDQDVGSTRLGLKAIREFGIPGSVRGAGRFTSFSNPAEISPALTQAAVDAGKIAPGETVRLAAIPSGQDGTSLTIGDFLDSLNTFRTNSGIPQRISISPASDRYTLRGNIEQSLADWLTVRGGVTYATRKTSSNSGAAVGNRTFSVPAANPYNPFGADVIVDVFVPGFGVRRISGDRDSLTVDLDFDGTLGNDWEWGIRSRLIERESQARIFNAVNYSALSALVDSSDPAEALNVFGDSFATDGNNAQVIADANFHLPVSPSDSSNRLASSELVVRGPLFRLPGGVVRLAAGGEWRKTSTNVDHGLTFVRVIDSSSPVSVDGLTNGFTLKGTKLLRAAFAEIFVPLASQDNGLPGMRNLGLALSGRHESADGRSSAGEETESRYLSNVWSTGLVYKPVETVKLRFNKSTSYRAPDVAQSLFPPQLLSGVPLIDVRGGGFSVAFIDNISGGNPALHPEESTSITGGIEIRPGFANGLVLRVDFHETAFRNRIASLNLLGTIILTDQAFAEFGFQYMLDEAGNVVAFDSRATNIARVDIEGYDYRLDYEFAVGENTFGLAANVSVTRKFLQDINTYDATAAEDLVGGQISGRRYYGRVFWRRGGWNLNLDARSRSGLRYMTIQEIVQEGEPTRYIESTIRTDPATIVDFRGSIDISEVWSRAPLPLQNMRLTFGLNNVFKSFDKHVLDPAPPGGLRGIPRATIDYRGQLYYLEISKEF